MSEESEIDVVVVDDDTLSLELIKRFLRDTTRNVRYFSDEIEALEYLENHRTRILIVDHRMPRLDGLDLLQRLMEGGGIGADHVYLWSAARPPKDVCDRAKDYGVKLLLKDVVREKAEFLKLISCVDPDSSREIVAG